MAAETDLWKGKLLVNANGKYLCTNSIHCLPKSKNIDQPSKGFISTYNNRGPIKDSKTQEIKAKKAKKKALLVGQCFYDAEVWGSCQTTGV